MASFELQNFKPGLDTRRYELTSVPGTLETLQNMHINQGGEIEKRKSFAAITSVNFPSTFGAQETATSIVVFGSATPFSLPTGFTYQQLQHPAVLAGTVYNPALHAMTGIICTCLFGAYAFAVATFADGTTWAYYNGVLVSDFTAGVILAYLAGSNTGIATNIKNLLTSTSQYALSTVSGAIVDVFGPVGSQYTVNEVITSALGTLTAQIKNTGLSSLPGTQAFAQFQIVAGAAGANNFISVVKLVGAAGQAGTNLLFNGVAVNWVTTQSDTAIAVANSISQYAATTGYYAIASAGTVLIYAVVVGTSTNNLPLSVTVNIPASSNNYNICIGNCAITFSGAGSAGAFAVTQITAGATNLLAAGVSQASLNAMVNALAIGINAHGTGYGACAVGATLYITKAVTASTDAAVVITPTTGTGVTAGASSGGSAVISLSTYIDSTTYVRHLSKLTQGVITSTSGSFTPTPISVILGGVTNPPYTYAWNLVSFINHNAPAGDGSNYIVLTAASKTAYQAVVNTAYISSSIANLTANINCSLSATYNCTVTDASSVQFTTANVVITINIQTIIP